MRSVFFSSIVPFLSFFFVLFFLCPSSCSRLHRLHRYNAVQDFLGRKKRTKKKNKSALKQLIVELCFQKSPLFFSLKLSSGFY